MCMHPQEALGFVTAPLVLVITPLSDITNKKSRASQADWARVTIYKRLYLSKWLQVESQIDYGPMKWTRHGHNLNLMKGVRWETVNSVPSIFLCPSQQSQGQGLSWYAFDRYGETKGIKLKKILGQVFSELGWKSNMAILKNRQTG